MAPARAEMVHTHIILPAILVSTCPKLAGEVISCFALVICAARARDFSVY